MAICGSCASRTDKGKTVNGALTLARDYVKKGSLDYAKQEYNFVINLLKCSSCRREIVEERDENCE